MPRFPVTLLPRLVLAKMMPRVPAATLPSRLALTSRSASSVSSSDELLLRDDDESTGVTSLRLNNPTKYNVLSAKMLDRLGEELDSISKDDSVRVITVEAAGDRAFCAGHDLEEIHSQTKEESTELFKKCSDVMTTLRTMRQPSIARVQGIATAAGCQLVLSCDLALCSAEARFGMSGIRVGAFCSTPAVALSRSGVPSKQALQLLLTGDLVCAETALSYGIIGKVVDGELLEEETLSLARKIAANSPHGVQLGKQLYYQLDDCGTLEEAYALATDKMVCNLQHIDAKRGIHNFVTKGKI
mmetsp:Transcript_38729/g.87276  ORF Transcript_38729/g.87276 Transcript_38729/m.87276 type:complete len:300 (+) Transcript_38729:301-1200(+)